jgi:hypothetical protein
LRQIRYGAKFGFDFEANKNKKIGKLRAFVKKQMKIALERKKPDESERIFLKNLPFNSNTLTNA